MNGRQFSAALVLLIATAWSSIGVWAQPPCPYAEIRLDTAQTVDAQAVCEAARPWAEKGFRVFVFVTDYSPGDEEEWFAFLDQAETDAGLRTGAEFDVNGLAFEASTAADLSWPYSVTYGEKLYDTRLDQDQSLVQAELREGIGAGDVTGALTQALGTAYEINYPPPTPLARALPWVMGGLVATGLVVVGGGALAVFVIRPAVVATRERRALERHREALALRTSNLLVACDQLLHGDGPEETVLYQLFAAYGGEQERALRTDVREWLRRSQEALRDAFDLRQRLKLSSPDQEQDLEQQVHDWEMLYVTLVGSSERVLTLTDEELRTLFDPMLTLDRGAPDVGLAEQLDSIRAKLAGMPLKVDFQVIDPAKADAEGILGYVDMVKAQISRLQDAQREAPGKLEKVKERRQSLGEQVPSPFVLTEKQLMDKIDERLAQATSDLDKGMFLRVTEHVDQIEQHIGTIESFLVTMGTYNRRRADVDAIVEQGYRSDLLDANLQEIDADIRGAVEELAAGDYDMVALWTDELNTDSERTLQDLLDWQEMQHQNASALTRLREWVERVEAYRGGEMRSAWEALQAYPRENWADAADGMDEAARSLAHLRDETLGRVEHLNSAQVQDLREAESLLAQATSDLTRAEGQFQTVVNCLGEVQVAEANVDQALVHAEAELSKARALRDQHDAKVSAEVDRQIEEAEARISEARRLSEARAFIPAMNAQADAVRLAGGAYVAAGAQIKEITELQTALQKAARSVAGKVGQSKARIRELPDAARRADTEKRVQRAVDALSMAKQKGLAAAGLEDRALAEALREASQAYETAAACADRALEQVKADLVEYGGRRREAEQAVRDAQSAIRQAQQAVDRSGGRGRLLLEKARTTLPVSPSGDESRHALTRIAQRAKEAEACAKRARAQARARPPGPPPYAPGRTGTTRRTGPSIVTVSTAPPPRSRPRASPKRSSSSRSSVSRSSSSTSRRARPSAASSARRSRSTGSSRRSTSTGTSRRSSSTGTSRRSGSSGSSRRK